MINLEKIPKIHEDVLGPVFVDLLKSDIAKPDTRFLEYLHEHNPGLLKVVKIFLGLCQTDKEYKLMISCLIVSLKAINNQLDINSMEL
jgi:hypothetical protein